MLETYKAKLHGDKIIWNDETPAAAHDSGEIDVIVTILSDEPAVKTPRPFGLARGQFVVPDDFDDPLPEEILAEFEN